MAELRLSGRFEFGDLRIIMFCFLNFKSESVVESFNFLAHSFHFLTSESKILGDVFELLREQGDFVLKLSNNFGGLVAEVHLFVLE